MGFLSSLVKTVAAPLIGGAFSAFGAERQNAAAQAASQKQMDFQREMSSTSYQRAMADMEAAGLNPVLAYQQGGASSPGGSTYSPVNVGAAAVTGAAGASSSAVQVRRTTAEIKNINAMTKKAAQDTRTSNMQLELMRAQAFTELQRKGLVGEERYLLQQRGVMNEPAVHSARSAASILRTPGGRGATRLGTLFRQLNPFMRNLPNVK